MSDENTLPDEGDATPRTETLFNIKLFDWKDWDYDDSDDLIFHDTTWHFASMKKYDGLSIITNKNGEFFIMDGDNPRISMFYIDIEEFMEELVSCGY